jgi:spore coat protein U-like protein
MKKYFLFILSLLIFQSAKADCSLTYSPVNLGIYNQLSGSSVVNVFTSTCDIFNVMHIDSPPQIELTNSNGDKAYVTFYNQNGSDPSFWSLKVFSGATSDGYSLYTNGSFYATFKANENQNLKVGSYIGYYNISYWKNVPDGAGGYNWIMISSSALPVSLQVNPTCTISTSGLNFGNYTSSNNYHWWISGALNHICTNGAAYSIALDSGNGTILNRKLLSGSNVLNYNLYTVSGNVFGDGLVGEIVTGVGTGTSQTTTVFGKIPQNQFVTPGNYSDTINVTLTY